MEHPPRYVRLSRRFSHYIAIDWSGAKGARHKTIAMAIADAAGGPPVLIKQERGWARDDVLTVLRDALPRDTLVGLDLGIALPFCDEGAYLPGHPQSPRTAPDLWQLIDKVCANDDHLGATSFVDHPDFAPYFRRHGGREGALFGGGRGRLRVTERAQEAQGCKPYSNFNLVGAAQVGKSSLTGMRMLHRLRGTLPVWPIDPLPERGCVVVEIYTALAAIAAGRTASTSKLRSYEALNEALRNLGSPPVQGTGAMDDHTSDALITAAWLRNVAHKRELWAPKGLTSQIAQTEGWTFGAI